MLAPRSSVDAINPRYARSSAEVLPGIPTPAVTPISMTSLEYVDEISRTEGASYRRCIAYRHTFRMMALRRLSRQLGGTIESPRLRAFLVLLAFFLEAFGLANISLREVYANNSTQADSGIEVSVTLGLTDNIAVFILGGLIVLVAWQIVEVVRAAILWTVLGLITYVLLQFFCAVFTESFVCGAKLHMVSYAVTGCVLGSIALWVVTHRLYPYLIRRELCFVGNVDWWWDIHSLGNGEPSQFSYRPASLIPCLPGSRALSEWLRVPRRRFGYDGEIDDEGRPHGVGTWHDSARSGELLHGVWVHGEPVGPFRATEYATGYTFKSVRVAYVHNRAEPLDQFGTRRSAPRLGSSGVCARSSAR